MIVEREINPASSALLSSGELAFIASAHLTLGSSPEVTAEATIVRPKGERVDLRVKHHTVYNITAPFSLDGRTFIAGRVERKNSEESEIYFFRLEADGSWTPIPTGIKNQDPAIYIDENGNIDLSGIEVDWGNNYNDGQPVRDRRGKVRAWNWETVFYHVLVTSDKETEEIVPKLSQPFNRGPKHMKDIRAFDFKYKVHDTVQKKVVVLGRPQGGEALGGRVTLTLGDALERVTADQIARAKFLHFGKDKTKPFGIDKDKWVGGNQGHVETILDDDGTPHYYACKLLHVAQWEGQPKERRYSPAVAVTELIVLPNGDIEIGESSEIEIIARREDFPDGPFKRKDLRKVVFSGGYLILQNGKMELYCGISDAFAAKIVIDNPFPRIIATMRTKTEKAALAA